MVQFPAPASQRRKRRADRKSTRLNSSHLVISYAVFCLIKKLRDCEQLRLLDQHRAELSLLTRTVRTNTIHLPEPTRHFVVKAFCLTVALRVPFLRLGLV